MKVKKSWRHLSNVQFHIDGRTLALRDAEIKGIYFKLILILFQTTIHFNGFIQRIDTKWSVPSSQLITGQSIRTKVCIKHLETQGLRTCSRVAINSPVFRRRNNLGIVIVNVFSRNLQVNIVCQVTSVCHTLLSNCQSILSLGFKIEFFPQRNPGFIIKCKRRLLRI